MSSQDKSPDAFRTISEVADDLDLPQHVLRFWETRFSQIKPLKRGGGRRYYRPDDVELLRGIRHLLYGEGYTIKGVQRILKEQGARFVMQIWKEDAIPVPVMQQAAAQDDPGAERHAEQPGQSGKLIPTAAGTIELTDDEAPLPKDVLADTHVRNAEPSKSGGLRFMDRFRPEKEGEGAAGASKAMSKDDVRRLQATLFELLECKRVLDQAR
ncbi:MerR family transcriptional regulator [Roseibium aggregatum]|uniref:MerR family transcriptional regulator n=1 Tax=Roseibium aggregatum TaxID=187304 RepID=A0A926NWE8_9HYPH|nr:MerR family transcriptional regulator [Roseibium aggregatum]MBD1545043.1 MerR family transcriptional regulator [Roseibium aggregatum]